MKVLVIGLDGSCMDLIKSWAHEGKLPTFQKLICEGSYGNLESVTPPLTIPAWNCLASGKNPGKFGCFSFVQKIPGSYSFQVYKHMVEKENDIWDILSNDGKKVFVLNAPNILKAYRINGYMVAGFLCLIKEYLTYPKGLKGTLKDMNYEKGGEYLIPFLTASDNEISKLFKEMTESICRVLFYFLEKDWNFGFVVFQELDGAQHRMWNKKNRLLEHYQNIDKKLKKIIDKLDTEDEKPTIIIASDHGFGPNKRMFLINEWLEKRGLLKIRKKPSFMFLNAMIRIVKRQNILKILKLLMKFPYLLPVYENILRQAVGTPVIWEKTKAFCYGNWGTIYINLSGREPKGIVKPDDYEQLRTEIIDGLKEISVKAYRREELYSGEYIKSAPDIIIQIDENVSSVSGKVGYNEIFTDGFPFDGYHDLKNGTFIAWGPNIKQKFEIEPKILDIAPTILHIMGLPIPKDMDGRILKEIFEENSEPFQRNVLYKNLRREFKEKELIKNKINVLKSMKKL